MLRSLTVTKIDEAKRSVPEIQGHVVVIVQVSKADARPLPEQRTRDKGHIHECRYIEYEGCVAATLDTCKSYTLDIWELYESYVGP